MVVDLFPPGWFKPELVDLVVDFLKNLPIPAEDKKSLIQGWAEESGVEVTAEIVEEVTGLPASEV